MILKKSYLKKLLALTLALSLSLSTVAQASFDSNAGSGDSSASSSSSPVSGSTYDDSNQGIRFYIVDPTGTIVGDVVDITYSNPYNYMELGNSAGQYLDTTKFGDFETTAYSEYIAVYSEFFPSYTLSDGTTMSAMPLPVDYISSSNIQVYGDTIREYFMGTREDTGEANLKFFVDDKGGKDIDGDGIGDGDIFGLKDHYNSTDDPSQLIYDNGLRIMAEPLMWYHPHNWDTTNNCLCTYSNIDYWVYGTPTGIGQHLVSLGITGSGGYATITHLYEPISMILMNNLTVGSQTIETTSEAGVPESGYRYTGTELASTTVGHALHSYSAEALGEYTEPSQAYVAYYFSVLEDQTVEDYEASLTRLSASDLTDSAARIQQAWNSASPNELVYPFTSNTSTNTNTEETAVKYEEIYSTEYSETGRYKLYSSTPQAVAEDFIEIAQNLWDTYFSANELLTPLYNIVIDFFNNGDTSSPEYHAAMDTLSKAILASMNASEAYNNYITSATTDVVNTEELGFHFVNIVVPADAIEYQSLSGTEADTLDNATYLTLYELAVASF